MMMERRTSGQKKAEEDRHLAGMGAEDPQRRLGMKRGHGEKAIFRSAHIAERCLAQSLVRSSLTWRGGFKTHERRAAGARGITR